MISQPTSSSITFEETTTTSIAPVNNDRTV